MLYVYRLIVPLHKFYIKVLLVRLVNCASKLLSINNKIDVCHSQPKSLLHCNISNSCWLKTKLSKTRKNLCSDWYLKKLCHYNKKRKHNSDNKLNYSTCRKSRSAKVTITIGIAELFDIYIFVVFCLVLAH